MSTDIHDKIRSEVERRLAIARAAEEWHEPPWRYAIVTPRLDAIVAERGGPVFTFAHHYEPTTHAVKFVELHDPADAIKRYEYALKVLDRHDTKAVWNGGDLLHYRCAYCGGIALVVCGDVLDLAESLGIDTGGQP